MTLNSYWIAFLITALAGITLSACKKEDEKISFLIINEGVYSWQDTADFRGVIFAAQQPDIKKFGLTITNIFSNQTDHYSLDSLADIRGNFHVQIYNIPPDDYAFQFYAETSHGTVYSKRDTTYIGIPL